MSCSSVSSRYNVPLLCFLCFMHSNIYYTFLMSNSICCLCFDCSCNGYIEYCTITIPVNCIGGGRCSGRRHRCCCCRRCCYSRHRHSHCNHFSWVFRMAPISLRRSNQPRIDPNDRQLNGKLFFFIALIPTIRSINKKSFYALGFFPRHYMEALVLFDVDLLTY